MPTPGWAKRKFFGRIWQTITRPRILARAGQRCEFCGAPNGAKVWRLGGSWWDRVTGCWRYPAGMPQPERCRKPRYVRIVLAVAHLNHVWGDDRDENLAALCNWCHLNYDRLKHKDTRCQHKDERRPLLPQPFVAETAHSA